jgi:DNA-binding LytR/AlgR family response regulator
MSYSYIIIDDDPESVLKTKAIAASFSELHFIAVACNYTDALNLIIEHNPKLIFLEIDPADKKSELSLNLINALYRYLKVIPKIIITTTKKDFAFEAIEYEVTDYLIKPLKPIDFKKLILKLEKSHCDDEIILFQSNNSQEKESSNLRADNSQSDEKIILFQSNNSKENESSNLKVDNSHCDNKIILFQSNNLEENTPPATTIETPTKKKNPVLCIKSYGDHRYIDSKDICYLHADNNSTDIHLNNGEVITAFKTLKHFEAVLSIPFIRIHNSYIINRNYIARIHTGNSVCYIKNTTVKLPFSKSYKKNIDFIISDFSNENYIEI